MDNVPAEVADSEPVEVADSEPVEVVDSEPVNIQETEPVPELVSSKEDQANEVIEGEIEGPDEVVFDGG